jgi:hypothetical protein
MKLATTIITAFLGGSPAAARTRKAAAPSVDLSGVGFDALHINPNANAIITPAISSLMASERISMTVPMVFLSILTPRQRFAVRNSSKVELTLITVMD